MAIDAIWFISPQFIPICRVVDVFVSKCFLNYRFYPEKLLKQSSWSFLRRSNAEKFHTWHCPFFSQKVKVVNNREVRANSSRNTLPQVFYKTEYAYAYKNFIKCVFFCNQIFHNILFSFSIDCFEGIYYWRGYFDSNFNMLSLDREISVASGINSFQRTIVICGK